MTVADAMKAMSEQQAKEIVEVIIENNSRPAEALGALHTGLVVAMTDPAIGQAMIDLLWFLADDHREVDNFAKDVIEMIEETKSSKLAVIKLLIEHGVLEK